VKNSLTGFICTCLLVVAGAPAGRAQEKKPDPAEQTPPAQQTPPPQTPPAGTPPAGQIPQPPPPAEDQPSQHGRVPEPPPPPVKVPDVRRPGESGFWIGVEGWFPKQKATFNKGNASNFTDSSLITMQGSPKAAEGAEVGAAVGLHNTLRLSYTDFRASGDFTTPVDVIAYTQTYTAGTYVSTNYHVQNFKLSYEYLTWPFPVGSRLIRLKTLWQVQFTQVASVFDSPLDYYNSDGSLKLDASGNPIDLSASKSKRIISPMFGLGFSYYPSRHLRIEAEGSGFGLPHRYYVFDGDVSLNLRVARHFELRVGGRGFGFKTSSNSDFFLKGTYAAAFFGLRWYSNSE
jgi:hypothetical protein